MGFSLIYSGSLIVLGQYFPQKLKLATTFAITGTGIGTFMYLPGIQELVTTYGWRVSYMITSAIALQICIYGALLRPKKIYNKGESKNGLDVLPTEKLISWGGMTPLHQGSLWSLNVSQHHAFTPNDIDGNVNVTHCQTDIVECGRRDEEKEQRCDTPEDSITLINKHLTIDRLSVRCNSPTLHNITIENENTQNQPVYAPIEYIKLTLLTCKTGMRSSEFFLYVKDVRFWCLSMAGFMNTLGVGVFMMLFKDFCTNIGLIEGFSFSMSALGLGDAVGRLLGGLFNSLHKVNTVLYYGTVQVLLSVIVFSSLFIDNSLKLVIVCALFGFTFGQLNVLLPQAPTAVYGVEKMSTILGYMLFFCGIGCIAGPPGVVTLVDYSGNYIAAFTIATLTLAFGSVLTYICYAVDKCCYSHCSETEGGFQN